MFSLIDEYQFSFLLEDMQRDAREASERATLRRALKSRAAQRSGTAGIARLARFRGFRISVKWAPPESGLAA
jgi:hypothetical protein